MIHIVDYKNRRRIFLDLVCSKVYLVTYMNVDLLVKPYIGFIFIYLEKTMFSMIINTNSTSSFCTNVQ